MLVKVSKKQLEYKTVEEYFSHLTYCFCFTFQEVAKWFAVGQYTNGMPDRPDIPASARIDNMLAIPVKPSSKAKIIWFLFPNERELK